MSDNRNVQIGCKHQNMMFAIRIRIDQNLWRCVYFHQYFFNGSDCNNRFKIWLVSMSSFVNNFNNWNYLLYKEQMQNQYYDQQYLQQNKQPLIQNQKYIQYPNHSQILYFPQMQKIKQNGYLFQQQQNYQQQDPLIYQQQPPYQNVYETPAQDVKVKENIPNDRNISTT